MKKVTLIPDARSAWRFASVRLAMFAVVWGLTPAETQAAILGYVGVSPESMPAIIGILFIVARVLTMATPDEPAEGEK